MKTSERVRARTESIVKILREQGPLSTAELAQVLGLPSPDTKYFGRNLRHIVGDLTAIGLTKRAGTYAKHDSRNLEQFRLVDPGELCTPVGPELDEPPPPEVPVVDFRVEPTGLVLEGRKLGVSSATTPVSTSRIVPKDLPAAPISAEPRQRTYPTTAKLGSDRLSSRDKLSAIAASGAPEKSLALRMIIDIIDDVLARVEGLEDVGLRLRSALVPTQDVAS